MLDKLIHNGIVVTMRGDGLGIIEDGCVGLKDNKIEVVGKSTEIKEDYDAERYIDAERKLVLPGLIDAHIHTGIAILRGLSQDISNWMEKGLWPFMQALEDDEIIKGSKANIIEGVKAGTTTFCDYDTPMNEIVKNHAEIGTRARVASTVNELPPDMSDVEVGELYPLDKSIGKNKLEKNKKLIKEWDGEKNGRISCLLGPQGPDMLSKELLLEVKELAKKYDTMIHMHVAQGDREINQMVKRYEKRSIPYLDEIDYLDERLMAVHLTEATEKETQLLAERGASMILCSGSIGIIDGIIPPMAEFLEVSDKAALGSDQAPGNNCNNMFNEMKFTSILNKCKTTNPEAFPAWKVLRLATIEAAKAIGLEDDIGSIEKGKKADLILVNLDEPSMAPIIKKPIRNIIPNLVYSARGNEVDTVIIDGDIVMENRELKTVDEKNVIMRAHEAGQQLANRAEKRFEQIESPLEDMMENDRL